MKKIIKANELMQEIWWEGVLH